MTFELNQVLIEGEAQTFSMMARTGQLTCLTGGTPERRTRWLLTMQGFLPISQGYVCIDGEPLTTSTASDFHQLIAYAPKRLVPTGEVHSYEPPSIQDVFMLRANRNIPISNGILGEEMRRIAPQTSDGSVQLLAVAALLGKPILLVDTPMVLAASYLQSQARKGKIVIVASDRQEIISASDSVVELS